MRIQDLPESVQRSIEEIKLSPIEIGYLFDEEGNVVQMQYGTYSRITWNMDHTTHYYQLHNHPETDDLDCSIPSLGDIHCCGILDTKCMIVVSSSTTSITTSASGFWPIAQLYSWWEDIVNVMDIQGLKQHYGHEHPDHHWFHYAGVSHLIDKGEIYVQTFRNNEE